MPVRRSTRFKSFVCPLFVAVLAIVTFAAPAFADTVSGRVVDPDNRAVADATVLIVSGTRVVASTKTMGDGTFGPMTVPAGEYDVLVSAPGLKSAPQTITVKADSTLKLDLKLALSAVSESVVVSAAQVDTPLSRTTDSVTVIDRATLDRRQTESVFDALRFVPGMGVVQSGGRGSVTSIFPRGGESDYTLVLVDGIEQNAFGGGFDAAHLAAGEVDRIEVVRGPESALYGDGAIGGIVQILTRRGGPMSGQAFVEGGGYGTTDGSASFSGGKHAWSWGGAVDWLNTDGDTRVFPSIGGPVSNDDYQRVDGSGTLAWSDRPDRQFRVTARGGRNELGEPGPYGSDPLGLYSGLDTVSRSHNDTRGLGTAASFNGLGLHHDVQFNWANFHSRFASPFGDSDDRTRRATARYQADLERHAIGVSAGVELLFERADNTFITDAAGSAVPITRGDTGLFVEARPALGDRTFLTAGLRAERIARRALVGDAFGRPPFDEDVVWSVNPKIGFAWFARPESTTGPSALGATKIRAHAGTGIKPPTAFDIAFTNNPDLKPERSRSVDIGVDQAFVHSTVVADATYFDNSYDDLIVSVGTQLSGASRFRTDNIANASSHGLETGVSWHSRVGVSVRGAWTFLHTETLAVDNLPSLAPTPYKVGDPLIRRPAQQGSLEIAWASGRGSLFLTLNGRGQMNDIEPNFGATVFINPGYTVVNFGGSLKIVHGLEITGRVLNAGDKQYEEALGFPALGRSAMIGVRVTAGR
jgi:outer membrane cobalamin receptor